MTAEFIGTFALVFVGCGAIIVDGLHSGVLGHTGISLAFGLIILVMIYATGHISGAHFNPAVTFAFASIGAFPWRDVPGYLLSQFAAALAASALLALLFGLGQGTGGTDFSGPIMVPLVLEVVLTFFLMFVITAVATDARAAGALAGVAIGGTVAVAALVGGPISGASMNPARSMGPALVSGELGSLWLYFVGPLVGAVGGAVVYRWLSVAEGSEAGGSETAGGNVS